MRKLMYVVAIIAGLLVAGLVNGTDIAAQSHGVDLPMGWKDPTSAEIHLSVCGPSKSQDVNAVHEGTLTIECGVGLCMENRGIVTMQSQGLPFLFEKQGTCGKQHNAFAEGLNYVAGGGVAFLLAFWFVPKTARFANGHTENNTN